MSSEPVDVQLARLDERMNNVLKALEDSGHSRKSQYEAIERIGNSLSQVVTRLDALERRFGEAQPTIEEFITIKHKVAGAGIFGRWIWIGGAFLLGLIASSREAIFHWFSRGA